MDVITRRLIGTIFFSVFFGIIAFYQADATLKHHNRAMQAATSGENSNNNAGSAQRGPSITMNQTPKTAYLLVSDGSEDMEVAMTLDIIRRVGSYIDLKLVGVASSVEGGYKAANASARHHVLMSKGMKVIPDLDIMELSENDLQTADLVIIPGGFLGVKNIRENERAMSLISNQIHAAHHQKLAAICAGPLAILDLYQQNKISYIDKLRVTSWPKFEENFANFAGAPAVEWIPYDEGNKGVIVSGNVITSQGPGTNFDFVLSVLDEMQVSREDIEKIKAGILY